MDPETLGVAPCEAEVASGETVMEFSSDANGVKRCQQKAVTEYVEAQKTVSNLLRHS